MKIKQIPGLAGYIQQWIIQHLSGPLTKISGARFFSDGGDNDGAFDGGYNLYVGDDAGENIQYEGIYGVNTAFGYGSLKDATATFATAIGAGALRESEGEGNAGGGSSAGRELKGSANALWGTTCGNMLEGNYNVGVGNGALREAVLYDSVGVGQTALMQAQGAYKIAIGRTALFRTHGDNLIGIGQSALIATTAGISNVTRAIVIGNNGESSPNHNYNGSDLSDFIVIGHNLKAQQSHTVNFPLDYDMGLGTLTPKHKLDVHGNIGIGENNWYYWGAPQSENSRRIGWVDDGFHIQRWDGSNYVDVETFGQ